MVRNSGVQGRTLHDVGCPSVTGFGGQLLHVSFPGKIMANRETQRFEWKDFIKRIVENIVGRFPDGPFRET